MYIFYTHGIITEWSHVYIFIYIYIHTYVYTYMHTYTHTYIHKYTVQWISIALNYARKSFEERNCPGAKHCIALLWHWRSNLGPDEAASWERRRSDEEEDDEEDDEEIDEERQRQVEDVEKGDEDDDWAYNLEAEEVSDLEVDEVREALEERGLDVEGDDALVRARLVQAITREQRLVKLEVREVAIVPGGSDLKFLAEEVSDLEVVEAREKLEDRGLDVEGDDATVRARLVQAIEEEKEREREREAARDAGVCTERWPWPAWPCAANLKFVFDHYASDGGLDAQGFHALLRDSHISPDLLPWEVEPLPKWVTRAVYNEAMDFLGSASYSGKRVHTGDPWPPEPMTVGAETRTRAEEEEMDRKAMFVRQVYGHPGSCRCFPQSGAKLFHNYASEEEDASGNLRRTMGFEKFCECLQFLSGEMVYGEGLTILSGLERHTADVRPMAELLRVPYVLRLCNFKYCFPRLTQREAMDQLLQLISRCKVAKSITSFLPPEHAIAQEDEEEEGEGARDDHREAEDVMETDNDDEELCSEEEEEEEEEEDVTEEEGSSEEAEGARGSDAWWEEKFDQIWARWKKRDNGTFWMEWEEARKEEAEEERWLPERGEEFDYMYEGDAPKSWRPGLSAFLEAEEVAQMEVDKVRKAKDERDLDAKGDDALVRARLVCVECLFLRSDCS